MKITPEYITRELLLSKFGVSPDSGAGRWRISELRKAGDYVPISRTWCRVGPECRFVVERTSRDLELARVVRPLVDTYCVWSLTSLNPLFLHQRIRKLTIVEVERSDQRMVFERLRAERFRNVILETESKWVADHIGGTDFDVVVRQLVTKAPLEDKKKGIPTLEKILVDLFIDGQTLAGIAPSDLEHLIDLAFTEYTIDVRVLRSYARRRSAWDRLKSYLDWRTVAPEEVLSDP